MKEVFAPVLPEQNSLRIHLLIVQSNLHLGPRARLRKEPVVEAESIIGKIDTPAAPPKIHTLGELRAVAQPVNGKVSARTKRVATSP